METSALPAFSLLAFLTGWLCSYYGRHEVDIEVYRAMHTHLEEDTEGEMEEGKKDTVFRTVEQGHINSFKVQY